MTGDGRLDVNFNGYPSEFEGIQVLGQDHLYLTVAYHSKDGTKTVGNQIFEVQW